MSNIVNDIMIVYEELYNLGMIKTTIDYITSLHCKIEFYYEKLHYYGYHIVYDIHTNTYYMINSSTTLQTHCIIITTGSVPIKVLDTIDEQQDEYPNGVYSYGYKRLRNQIGRWK